MLPTALIIHSPPDRACIYDPWHIGPGDIQQSGCFSWCSSISVLFWVSFRHRNLYRVHHLARFRAVLSSFQWRILMWAGIKIIFSAVSSTGNFDHVFDEYTQMHISDIAFFPSETGSGYNLFASAPESVLYMELNTGRLAIVDGEAPNYYLFEVISWSKIRGNRRTDLEKGGDREDWLRINWKCC